ncbi:hypothetical protein H6P81_012143 [Aristolochia fimbriata]|uniref:Uncharacterized protein n=1 Tax=Aristolochia fimbriata TaxID=158543 RepID=A0AAV7EAZ7_ARIFI|nr:hypothetical protein H6P81_012143 [Aristolochia fimbriata]
METDAQLPCSLMTLNEKSTHWIRFCYKRLGGAPPTAKQDREANPLLPATTFHIPDQMTKPTALASSHIPISGLYQSKDPNSNPSYRFLSTTIPLLTLLTSFNQSIGKNTSTRCWGTPLHKHIYMLHENIWFWILKTHQYPTHRTNENAIYPKRRARRSSSTLGNFARITSTIIPVSSLENIPAAPQGQCDEEWHRKNDIKHQN